MIREVSGDILLSQAQLIAHGVAPNDAHAAGLALALRDYAPAMYKDFRHFCKTQHPGPGGLWVWSGANGQRIAALFTQGAAYETGQRPGRATLNDVRHALRALKKFIEQENVTSVALPRLATGVGGLEWQDVKPIVHAELGTLPIPVIVYETYHAGQRAVEF